MFLHRLVLAAALAVPLAAAAPAAQGASPGAAAIEGVDVEQVAELGAGVALRFAVYGTPRSTVALRIEGGWRALALRESEPGVYEGTYVIDARDAVTASSRVTATLQHDGRLASAVLDEPLLLASAPLPWAEAAALPAPAAAPAPSPRSAPAPVAVAPVPPVAAPGHVVVAPAAPATTTTTPAAPATSPPSIVVARSPRRVACDDCAYVQSVRIVEPTPGGPIGAVAGAIAGAVLGSELGEAHHRRMLGLLGAIGGGLVGREVGRQATQRVEYDVVLRTSDGLWQVRRFDHLPPFGPGDTVRLGEVRRESAPGRL